jgi:proline iminopeptidase
MAIARVNGTDLFYEIVGTGLPCLVLHGGMGLDHTYFHPWLDPLGDLLQLISYDQRGNGRSSPSSCEDLTFDQLCRDADALRATRNVEHVALLGHSFGGFIALEYALRYPHRVSHLILVGTAPSFDYAEEIQANVQRKNPTAETLAAVSAPPPATDADFARLWHALLPLYFHNYDSVLMERAFGQTIYRGAAAACNDTLFAVYNVAARLGEIQAPTLVVVGDDDFVCPPSQARRLQLGIPNAQLTILSACGHFPFIECAAAFEATVRSWLAQIP